jgi:DNA-binding MarR family transcriptional regulator
MSLPESFVATLSQWIQVFMRRSMRNLLLYSRQKGFTHTQMATLFMIQRKESNSVSDIGDELGISNAAASQMLERLVQMGLIQRSEDPHDRRFKQIVLTEQGNQALQESIKARESWFIELADSLTDNEKAQVVAALNLLIEKANLLEQQPEEKKHG